MDLAHVTVQLLVAIACAIIGNILIPRQVPGKLFGLIVIGFVGVALGEWAYRLLRSQFKLDAPFLHWHVADVPIIPAIIGSAIVLYIVTSFWQWGRYGK